MTLCYNRLPLNFLTDVTLQTSQGRWEGSVFERSTTGGNAAESYWQNVSNELNEYFMSRFSLHGFYFRILTSLVTSPSR